MIVEHVVEIEEFRTLAHAPVHWNFYVQRMGGDAGKAILRYTSLTIEERLVVCDVKLSEYDFLDRETVNDLREKALLLVDTDFPDSTEGEYRNE